MAEERTVKEIISSSKMDEETADRVIEDYNAGDLSIEGVKTAAEVSDICNDPYIMHEVVSRLEDGFSKDRIMKASNEFELANDEDGFLQDIASDRIPEIYNAIEDGFSDKQIDFLEGRDSQLPRPIKGRGLSGLHPNMVFEFVSRSSGPNVHNVFQTMLLT